MSAKKDRPQKERRHERNDALSRGQRPTAKTEEINTGETANTGKKFENKNNNNEKSKKNLPRQGWQTLRQSQWSHETIDCRI